MVGLQAITKYVEAQLLAEQLEVGTAVVINGEHILTVVAALNNVVRLTGHGDSGYTDAIASSANRVFQQPHGSSLAD